MYVFVPFLALWQYLTDQHAVRKVYVGTQLYGLLFYHSKDNEVDPFNL